jgi:anti-sigma factor RsiW
MTTDLHELSGAYVLDAVDDIERAAFARHLAECEACTAEVAELRQVTEMLGELTETPPPAALRANVLAAARQTPQAGPDGRVPGTPVKPAAQTRRTGRRRPTWLVAAVAAAAAVVISITGTAVVMTSVMDSRLENLDRQVQALQTDRARIYAIMNAKDAVMKGNSLPGGGRVAAAVSEIEQGGVAMLAGLKLPPAGEVYQMWFMAGTRAISSALVVPAGLTGGTMLFDHWTSGANKMGVTLEPTGGSPLPTSRPLVDFDIV